MLARSYIPTISWWTNLRSLAASDWCGVRAEMEVTRSTARRAEANNQCSAVYIVLGTLHIHSHAIVLLTDSVLESPWNLLLHRHHSEITQEWLRKNQVRTEMSPFVKSSLKPLDLGRSYVFFDIEIGQRKEGRVTFELVSSQDPNSHIVST